MKVIAQGWVIKRPNNTYVCSQNTTMPKLYVSETSAKSSAEYHYIAEQANEAYKVNQAYLVEEEQHAKI